MITKFRDKDFSQDEKLELKKEYFVQYQYADTDELEQQKVESASLDNVHIDVSRVCQSFTIYIRYSYEFHALGKVIKSSPVGHDVVKEFVIGTPVTLNQIKKRFGEDSEIYLYLKDNWQTKKFLMFSDGLSFVSLKNSWNIISPENIDENGRIKAGNFNELGIIS